MPRWFCSLLLAIPLGALADASVMTRVLKERPVPSQFSFCWGGTCAEVLQVSLSEAEWGEVRELFDDAGPQDADAERELIPQAIALLERLVGPKTGTDGDRAGTYGNSEFPGQLDCNDETTNTSSYLRMMIDDGLIRFHRVLDTTTRGFLIFGRHSTAVIEDTGSGERFAVDAWFYDNGQPAVVLPLAVWHAGWKPGDSAAH